MAEHVSEVAYNNSDDGIWIECVTCHHDSPPTSETLSNGYVLTTSALGHFPSVEDVVALWQKHLDGEW